MINTSIFDLYGKNGFFQIQILIEENNSEILIDKILNFFSRKKAALLVLCAIKEFGPGNNNYLSFPNKGYTFIIDLKITEKINEIYREFEDLLKNYKTKIYLTKDSFMSEQYKI